MIESFVAHALYQESRIQNRRVERVLEVWKPVPVGKKGQGV